MSILEEALSHQRELQWYTLGLLGIALLYRLLHPAERRSLRTVWALLVLIALAQATAYWLPMPQPLVQAAMAAALVLGGLACIQLAAVLLFRGLLPLLRLGLPRIAQDLTGTTLSLAWGLLWLHLLGVEPSQLFTTSALITAVLAFSMQDTLGNVLGGVALQLDNSLRVGDWVKVEDVSGRVVDVRWRYTAVETRNRETIMVPNSWLMKNRFLVLREGANAPLAWRRFVYFNVDPLAPPTRVIQALERAVLDADIAHVLKDPPPNALLWSVEAGYNRYALRYWLADPRYDDPGDSAVRVHALAALARAGVRLGVPQEERLNIREDDRWREAYQQRDLEHRLHAIAKTELFAKLSPQEQQALAAHLVHAPFVAGDCITRQGAVAHWLYLVIRGDAQVQVQGPQGPLLLNRLHDGDFFGEMGMLTGEPRAASVVALTDVECYRLDKQGFAEILQKRPEIATEISALVEARNAQRDAALAQLGQAAHAHGDVLDGILRFFSIHS